MPRIKSASVTLKLELSNESCAAGIDANTAKPARMIGHMTFR